MMRRATWILGAVLWAVVLAGCVAAPSKGITQVSTIDALLAGVYDGQMSLATLREYGDFGLGTFEGLDGEMVLLDGTFYKIRADGRVYRPALSERTPFACVTTFVADHKETLAQPTNLQELEARIDAAAPQQNRFCAFMVRGEFRSVRARSVAAQKPPYPPLAEVTKTQAVFVLKNVRGTLVGFRSPAWAKGVNVPGYHLHFLADDLSCGGHVLDLELTQGALQTETLRGSLTICLPKDSAYFDAADLAKDRSAELQAAEAATRPAATTKP